LLLAACATAPAREELALRLSPASLGHELALQQHMTVSAYGQSQQLDVAIEVDAEAVRMAVMDFGQTVARLEWDGHDLSESRARGWPEAVTGSRVLSDLQLVHWPLEAIRPALPEGWSVQEDAQGRTVRRGDVTVIRVRYPAPGSAELENLATGYRLRLDAWPSAPAASP
jgi:hypothetical protein